MERDRRGEGGTGGEGVAGGQHAQCQACPTPTHRAVRDQGRPWLRCPCAKRQGHTHTRDCARPPCLPPRRTVHAMQGMPRPCPRCHSNVFFEREPPPASSSSAASAASAPTASAAGGASSTPLGGGGGGEVVAWRSRPLCCDMCGAWVHMGCARVNVSGGRRLVPKRGGAGCRDGLIASYEQAGWGMATNPR